MIHLMVVEMLKVIHMQGPVAVPVEKCTQVPLYHSAPVLMIRIGTSLIDALLIPGTTKALSVGAREKAKSGDKAGERIFCQNNFQQPMMSL